MKKKLFLPLIAISTVVLVASCMKNNAPKCNSNTVEQDKTAIDAYISQNGFTNITYKPSSGTLADYYGGVIIAGTGSTPAADSLITFDRVVRLFNGTVIDSTQFPTNQISPIKFSDVNSQTSPFYNPTVYTILGMLKEGGMYRVIDLSRNAYGCTGASFTNGKSIPANSQVITDYRLVDVKKAQ